MERCLHNPFFSCSHLHNRPLSQTSDGRTVSSGLGACQPSINHASAKHLSTGEFVYGNIDRSKHVDPQKHSRVISLLEVEIRLKPVVVMGILGAEIALDPIHTYTMDAIRKGSGLAIRFPRFTGNYRLDKTPEDATTSVEILEMYRNQLKNQ